MKLRAALQIFMILAFIHTLVSPACAFISGKDILMEICAADGSIQTIKVDKALTKVPSDKQNHEKSQNDCAFCFANNHISKILNAAPAITVPISSNYFASSSGTIIPRTLNPTHFQARAPPVLS